MYIIEINHKDVVVESDFEFTSVVYESDTNIEQDRQ